ncbi:unnamed protein product [Rotaria sp. Silwood1]|nr:unnamed protein product [Rotaria sp. Silwood1]CAF4847718.1 unnamed protein product [Rotaria sp. Silwood1]
MSSNNNFFDVRKAEHIQSGQVLHPVVESSESVAHSGKVRQHSFAKKSYDQYQSNNAQHYSTDFHSVEHSITHVPLGPISSYYYQQEELLHTGLTVMIMAPEQYRDLTKKKMLFEPFPIPYKSSREELLNEILKQRRDETGKLE